MTPELFLGNLRHLKRAARNWNAPVVTLMARHHADPFRILVSTLLSLRTQDAVTAEASTRLFAVAATPHAILALPQEKLEKLIYPVGFYRNKARHLKATCAELIGRFQGQVPDDLDALLALKGVGRKTANLVLAEGFGKPAICVDTHVHRITNRIGLIKTKTPEQTEFALMECLPKRAWKGINSVLVAFGQTICRPIGPKCALCPVSGCPSRRAPQHQNHNLMADPT